LSAAKSKSSPFGRLVDAEKIATADTAAPTATRELSAEQRTHDRRQLSELLTQVDAELEDLMETIEDQLGPVVRTLTRC